MRSSLRATASNQAGRERVPVAMAPLIRNSGSGGLPQRSEEHTSELQSRQYLVCRLLLEKKKKNQDATFRGFATELLLGQAQHRAYHSGAHRVEEQMRLLTKSQRGRRTEIAYQ